MLKAHPTPYGQRKINFAQPRCAVWGRIQALIEAWNTTIRSGSIEGSTSLSHDNPFKPEIYVLSRVFQHHTGVSYMADAHSRMALPMTAAARVRCAEQLMTDFFTSQVYPAFCAEVHETSEEDKLIERSDKAVRSAGHRREMKETFMEYKRRLYATGDEHLQDEGPDHREYVQFLTTWGRMEQHAARHQHKERGVSNVLAEWQPSEQAWLSSDTSDTWMLDVYLHVTVRSLNKRGIAVYEGAALQIHPENESSYSFRGVVRAILPSTHYIAIAVNINEHQHESFERVTITDVAPIDPIQRSMDVIPHVANELQNHTVWRTVTNRYGVTAERCSIPVDCADHAEATTNAVATILEPFNEEQKQAQQAATHSGVVLILGPPGTGKSSCAVAIILAAIMRGERVIVSAASNDAADQLHLRLLHMRHKHRSYDSSSRWNIYRANAKSRQWEMYRQKGKDKKSVGNESSDASRVVDSSLFEHARKKLLLSTDGHQGDRCTRLWQEYTKRTSFASTADQTYFENCVSKVEKKLLEDPDTKVVVATCSSLAGNLTSAFSPHTMLFDEASTITELELTAALKPSKADTLQRVVLIGDPAQLPPCVISTEAKRTGVSSWMERLWQCRYTGEVSATQHMQAVQLVKQYRCHPGLTDFSNEWIYVMDGMIKGLRPLETPADITAKRSQEGNVFRWNMNTDSVTTHSPWPIAWLNVEGQEDSRGHGYDNPQEADATFTLIRRLLNAGFSTSDIAVITPYRRQVDMIKSKLSAAGLGVSVRVGSVDATQGLEYKCVIMSTVRTASEALPFVKDLRRSNVSLTRAKVAFFFIGHYEAVCSRAHKSKSYEIRRANEAWYWLGTELSKRHQVFDCDTHTLENLITTSMETSNVNTTQPTTTSGSGSPGDVQQHTPSMSVDGRVLYDMKRVRSDQQVTCACEACTPFGSKEPYSLDDICDADLREKGPDGQYGMVAALSYRLHFLCNSNPTPLDLWKIWQRSGTSQGDPTKWGFDLSKVIPVLLCPRWRAMHSRGLELCPSSLGTSGRGDSRYLRSIYEGTCDETWCSMCTSRTRAERVGIIEGVPGIHNEVPYTACSPECEAKLKKRFEKMVENMRKQLSSTEQDEFYAFVQQVSAALMTGQDTVHTSNSVQSGEISLLPRDWAGKPPHTYKVGRNKTFTTVIPHEWLRTTTPDELFQSIGLIHKMCNNVHLGTATTEQYKSLHPVQLSAHTDASTWRPIRDRLPLYLGYGVPFIHTYSSVMDTVVLGQYPDVRYGMHRSQIACAQGRDNTPETGLKPKCVQMLLQNMRDSDIEAVRTSLGDDNTQQSTTDGQAIIHLGQQTQEAIHQARMVGAWNSMVWRVHWNDKSRRDVDPDDDPDRVLMASVRSMCLAAQACILAYFAGAYALAGEDIAVQAGLPHKVHDRYNHLKAGPGATGDPETRPDMPLGHYRFERGYLIGFQDNSDGGSIEWAICEKIKFGPRPIRVRVLGSNEVKRISIDDIRYVQRNISSQYAQCTLVTTNSDDPGTAGTGNLECRRKSIIAAIIFAAIIFNRYPRVSWNLRTSTRAVLIHTVWRWYWNVQSECMATWWECPHGAVHVHGPYSDQPARFQHPQCMDPECIRTARASWQNYLRIDCGQPSPTLFIPIGLQHTEGDDGTHGREHDHGQMIHAVSHAGSTADVKYTALHSHQEYENHPTPLTTGTVHAMVYRI